MTKWVIVSVIILAGIIWITNSLWLERSAEYLRTRREGKIWHLELEKQINLYSADKKVIFLGDSHMEQCEWAELFPCLEIGNRGIPGETSEMTMERMAKVVPDSAVVFLQIGVNDILGGLEGKKVVLNQIEIIRALQNRGCQVIPTLIFPTRFFPEKNEEIVRVNQQLKDEYKQLNVRFIDLSERFVENGRLSQNYTGDGVHLNSAGYKVWKEEIGKQLIVIFPDSDCL